MHVHWRPSVANVTDRFQLVQLAVPGRATIGAVSSGDPSKDRLVLCFRMQSVAPNAAYKRTVSYMEGYTRTTLSTLAAGSLSYCVVHIGQQMFRVQYGKKYQVLVPALIGATVAAYTTATKIREYKLQ